MNAATQQAPTTTTREPVDLDAMLEEANRAMQRMAARGQDTKGLNPAEKENILAGLARALGLNPLSNPVRFLPMQGGEVLYVTRQGTDQIAARLRLRRETTAGPEIRKHGAHEMVFCQVRVTAPDGRSEMATATLPLKDITNDLMKCETKAKRRATLSLAGLGLLSEDETETIPGAQRNGFAPSIGQGDPQPVAALDAFRLDLADVTDLRSLRVCWESHSSALHDAGDLDTARTEARTRTAALRYDLTAAELQGALSGNLHPAYLTALDELTEIDRHADDEDGDGVIADVVRVLRAAGDAPKASKGHIATAAVKRATALGVPDAKPRITAALTPTPPTTPTGTDAPAAGAPANGSGAQVAASESAGATMRLVLDADEAEARLVSSANAWGAHLIACVGTFAMAGAYHKRRDAFRTAGVDADRYAATLAAIVAHEGRGEDAARQALDGYRTRRVMPQGVGAVIRMTPRAQRVAQRTGTDG